MNIIVKFFRPEHVLPFLQGKLFFMNAGYFIDLEETEGRGIGDKYEGAHFRNIEPEIHQLFISTPGTDHHRIPLNFTRAYSTIRYDAAREFHISCFTRLTFDDVEKVDEDSADDGEPINIYKLKKTVVENLNKEFPGRIPVLISDIQEFGNRLKIAAEKKEIGFTMAPVTYFNEFKESYLSLEDYESDIRKGFLYKRKCFEPQKEYRVFTSQPYKGESLILEMGDISDITYELENLSDMKIKVI